MSNAPFLAPIFSRSAGLLKYVPYPDYADPPVTAWDLSVEFAAIVAAEAHAQTGITNAAAALASSNIALANAAAALAAATAITPKNRRVTLWHHEANPSGGTLTLAVDALTVDNHLAFSTVSGFSAVQSFDCDLMPACKLFFMGVTNNSSGIMGIYIDGNFYNNLDWYSAAQVRNVIKPMSFAAGYLTAGRHTLKLEVSSKNTLSSAFNLSLTKYWLAPDVD